MNPDHFSKHLGRKNSKGLAFRQLAFACSCARKWLTLSIVHKARAIPSPHNFAVCYLSDFWKNGKLLYTHNSPNQCISSEQLENRMPIANQPFTIPASTYFPLQFIWQSWSKSFKMFQDSTKGSNLVSVSILKSHRQPSPVLKVRSQLLFPRSW